MKRTSAIAVLGIILLSSMLLSGASSAYTYVPPFSAAITSPAYVASGQAFSIYVNETNGFTNYTITAYVSGENMSGASPSFSYHNFQAKNPDFRVGLNAPNATETLYITFIVAADYGGAYIQKQYSYQVEIIAPIIFHAEVSNEGSFSVHNMVVNFYVDGTYVGNSTVASIAPNQHMIVNYTYVNPYLSNGQHTLKVSTSTPLVQINGNTGSSTTNFYYGTPPNYNWIFYVAAVVVAFMVFFAYSAGRRPASGARPPKWRK